MRASMFDVKPCPFCGGPARLEMFIHKVKGEVWYVQCGECKASTWYYATMDDAMKEWNKRASLLKRLLRRLTT